MPRESDSNRHCQTVARSNQEGTTHRSRQQMRSLPGVSRRILHPITPYTLDPHILHPFIDNSRHPTAPGLAERKSRYGFDIPAPQQREVQAASSTQSSTMATTDGASSIKVTVRVRPFTIREAAQITKTDDGPLFLGDGSLAGVPTPKLNQKGIRSIVKVIDDRCLYVLIFSC